MNSTQSYHPPPFGPPHRHSHPHTLSRSRSAIDASQQKTRIDRYVPRVMSSSYLSAPLAEAASPSPAPRAHHGRHRQHSHQRSRKSPTVDRSKDVPKSHPRIKRKTDSFYASRRRSAAALARSLKEQQTADPESRLDLGRDMLWALMAEAGLSPLASGPVTREDLLHQEDPIGWSGSDEEYESENEASDPANADKSSMSMDLDKDIDDAFADLGLDL